MPGCWIGTGIMKYCVLPVSDVTTGNINADPCIIVASVNWELVVCTGIDSGIRAGNGMGNCGAVDMGAAASLRDFCNDRLTL